MATRIVISAIIGFFLLIFLINGYFANAKIIALSLSVLPLLWVVLAYLILKDTSGNHRPAEDEDFYHLPE